MVERHWLRRSMAETSATIARRSGGDAELEGGMALFACAPPGPLPWNGALRLGPRVTANELLERADAFFRPLGRRYSIITMEGVDDEIDARLEQLEHSAAFQAPAMVATAPLTEPPSDGIELTTVNSDQSHRDSLAVLAAAFEPMGEDPENWDRVYPTLGSLHADDIVTLLATSDGEPVGAGMVYLGERGAELINIGTTPDQRGRGIGGYVTCALTNLAFERGAEFVSLQATKLGAGVYRNIGFRDVTTYRWYVSPAGE